MEQKSTKEGCSEAGKCMKILHLMLDNEASTDEENYLRDHLESCLPCLKNYQVESEIRHLLRTKLAKKHVPKDLLDSIRDKITVSMSSQG